MANPDVTDETLQPLLTLELLKELDLNNTKITDAALPTLAKLPNLEILRLKDTRITDAGFQTHLAPKETLTQLDLRGTTVKSSTVRAWKAAKPGRRALQ